MKLGIMTILLVLPLAACAAEQTPGLQPSEPDTEVVLVSESDGGGVDVSHQLTPLDTPERLNAFAAKFNDHLAAGILSEAAEIEVPTGEVLAGALAYVGCGKPTEAEVVEGDAGLELLAGDADDADIQCVVAVTTVGLVPVDGADL